MRRVIKSYAPPSLACSWHDCLKASLILLLLHKEIIVINNDKAVVLCISIFLFTWSKSHLWPYPFMCSLNILGASELF